MSRSVNSASILGRLGKDSETKLTQGGVAVTNFSVATERTWKNKTTGEWDKATDWHNVVIWKAEKLAEYLKKGQQVFVEGRLQTRSYDDREGTKRYVTEIVANQVVLCGQIAVRGSTDNSQPAAAAGYDAPGITDDDVPF